MSDSFEYCYMMSVGEANKNFLQIVKHFFDPDEQNGNVYFAYQSRTPRHPNPLILITAGSVRRDRCATVHNFNGATVASRESSIVYTVDLYTDGREIVDEDTGYLLTRENTAMNDLLNFLDFLDSDRCLSILNRLNAAINIENDAQDMTGIVSDSNYEFRARADIRLYFTDPMIGVSGIAAMSSIVWPTDDGKAPEPTESVTGQKDSATIAEEEATVEPKYEPDSSGGGSEELVEEDDSYFTEAELTEETDNE